ncbi:MAG: methyltransferase domain-containing protein [bacterium]
MKSEESYSRFRSIWTDPLEAIAYREARFSRSRRWRWTHRKEMQAVIRFLVSTPETGPGLDVPCGAGRLLPCFERVGRRWLGVDVSLAMARLAKATGKGPSVVADATALPFRQGVFAFAVCMRLLHRIRQRTIRLKILGELGRLCTGPMLLSYYTRWNLRGIQRWIRGKYPGLSLKEIRGELKEAGLEIIQEMPLRRITQQQWLIVVKAASSAPRPPLTTLTQAQRP